MQDSIVSVFRGKQLGLVFTNDESASIRVRTGPLRKVETYFWLFKVTLKIRKIWLGLWLRRRRNSGETGHHLTQRQKLNNVHKCRFEPFHWPNSSWVTQRISPRSIRPGVRGGSWVRLRKESETFRLLLFLVANWTHVSMYMWEIPYIETVERSWIRGIFNNDFFSFRSRSNFLV